MWISVYDHKNKVIFSDEIELNDVFEVGGTKKRIPPRMRFEIWTVTLDESGTAGPGEWKETIQFHTSCSQPLFVGDEYGSLTLVGSTW